MCDRNSVLIIFFILKILILVVFPITLFVLYKKGNKLFNTLGIVNIFFIILLIVLRLFSNPCVSNSKISYIWNNSSQNMLIEHSDTLYESIHSSEQFTNGDNKKAYYYDINNEPLGNISLSCKNKSYIKNYGGSISAITTLIGNYYNLDVNEIDILTILEENKLIDCDNGINFDKAFNGLSKDYYYKIIQISSTQINNYLNNGQSVLVETTNKYNEDNNFGCEKDYIVIYNINNDGLYNIINSNDKYESYFCPSNTIGYGSIIEGNQNDRAYTLEEINSKALRYFVIEGV